MPIQFPALPLLRQLLLPVAMALPAALLPSASAATTVSMGYGQGCSAADTDQVTCWGNPPLPALGPDYRAKDVRVGRDFGCLLAGNNVRCWGNNDFQQLGKPTAWGTIADVYATQIAAGATHACALVYTYVQCWGDASQGQLGQAYMVPTAQAVQVEGLSRVRHVAAGNGSTCAVRQDGTVVCVGAGSGLVEGSMDPRLPRTLPGITDALEVALFDGHACVLRTGGKVSCWGSNLHGELGVPASTPNVMPPVEVPGLAAAAKSVAVGLGYTCALLVNGTVSCWGSNANGQLGTGLGGPGASQVTGITDAIAISAGKSAACAALQGGYVQCWGEGAGWSNGICRVPGGLYPSVPSSWGPTIEPAVCHSQGSAAPMAVKGLGAEQDAMLVLDWAEKTLPQPFAAGAATVRDPADKLYLREYAGGHRLGVNGHGSARLLYLGPYSNGQLFDLGGLPHWVDQATKDLAAQSGIQFRAAPYYNIGLNTGLCNLIVIYWVRSTHPGGLPAGFAPTSLRVENDGGLSAEVPIRDRYVFPTWTSETDWSGNVPPPDPLKPIPPGVKQEPVHRGAADGCVTGFYNQMVDVILTYTIDGKKGQSAPGPRWARLLERPEEHEAHERQKHSAPASRLFRKALALAALALPAAFCTSTATATTLSMGTSHGCSVADTGVATCWGSLPMVPLAHGLRADDIRVGQDFSCALTNVSVQCWGSSNAFSQLGNPVLQAPWGYTLSGLRQIAGIAVGARHGCARTSELEVYCWGDGSQGQIGSAVATTTAEAVRVEGMASIAKVAAGRASTCGVMDVPNDRKVICVGAGSGLAGAAQDPRTARAVPGITDAMDVSLFASHACALRAFGKVSCWGSNQHGELGVPASSGPLTTPVEVPDLGAPAKAVAVGDGFTCALLEGGSIKCWGNNANGQLGMGLTPGAATPATDQVAGISNAIAISAGKTAACAVLEGGYVQCWGEGAGWSSAPCRVSGGLYPGVPASYGPVVDNAICRPQGSAAPMAVTGLGPANDAAQVLDWAEKTLPQTFPRQPSRAEDPGVNVYLREYPGGHKLAINAHGTPRLLYMGPLSAGQVADLGPLSRWIREAALDEGLGSGLQLQAGTNTNFPLGPCAMLSTTYGIRGATSPLPEGLVSSSVQVTVGGRSVEHSTGGGERRTIMTNDTDWISPGTHIPGPGTRLEPVQLGNARGCSNLADLKSEVEVTVFYTIGNRKGALRTRAQMTTSS